jgi:putative flippase GtrA
MRKATNLEKTVKLDTPTVAISTIAQVTRFAAVGAVASAVYAGVVLIVMGKFGLSSALAGAVGYIVAIPVSFLGQKRWTFRAQGKKYVELCGFVVVQAANTVLSALAMMIATDVLGFHPFVGIVVIVLLLPAMTYFVLLRKVFNK